MNMRKLLTLLFVTLFLNMGAQTVTQTFYVDFGYNNNSSKGMMTTSEDENGHYWTNVACGTDSKYIYPDTSFQMVNSNNEKTSYTIFTNTRFSANGKTGGGGLLSPSKELLGDLAIGSATEDYLYTEGHQNYLYFTIKGLDKNKGYRFYTFGSRTSTDNRKVMYRFQGENLWTGTLQTGGVGIGENNYNGNNNKVIISDVIFPDRDGNITFTLIKVSGRFVPVNAMKIEELEGLEGPNQTLALANKYYIDFGENNKEARGYKTSSPDVNGNYWNNIFPQSGNLITSGSRFSLITSDNDKSALTMTMGEKIRTNGRAGGGGLTNPTKENLGDVAITTATEDYIFIDNTNSTNITLSGLNKNNCYKFFFFGSRNAGNENTRRETILTLSGQKDWTSWMITSGSSIGGKGVQGNVRNIEQSDYIYPDIDGNIVLTIAKNTANTKTNFAHVNLMWIEEYSGGVRPSDGIFLKNLKITGSAVEDGNDVYLKELNPKNTSTRIFETYLRLGPGNYRFEGLDINGDSVVIGGGSEVGKLIQNGDEIVSSSTQVVRIVANIKTMTYTITPVNLFCEGNIVPDSTILSYQGNGVFSSTVDLNKENSSLYAGKSFYFSLNNADSLLFERIVGTTDSIGMPSMGFSTEYVHLNNGTYTVTVDLRNYHFDLSADIDEYKISVFGSSVSNGQGAGSNHGYAYLYDKQLQNRYNNEESNYPFHISSIAINGNNTINLLNRYSDLTNDFGRYVIIGLSLGNEGIHNASNPQAIFNQFKNNMQKLIEKARADGKIPVVMNNYARGDFSSTDYHYIKAMNLFIHQWDVPSVNMLGAIDNGQGVWATNYWSGDIYHPNTAGHQEFMYAMVPSLFDAIKEGKQLPDRDLSKSMVLGNKSVICFKGEGTVHPFAINLRVKGGDEGSLLSVSDNTGSHQLSINANGQVVYNSSVGSMTSTTSLSDGEWHSVTLSCYYAQKRTLLFVDNEQVGELSENFAPIEFVVGDSVNSISRSLSELAFWRSALNNEEVEAWNSGKILRSSLEIYSPLSKDSIENLAVSENNVVFKSGTISDKIDVVEANDGVRIYTYDGGIEIHTYQPTPIQVIRNDGACIYKGICNGKKTLNGLAKGIYLVNKTKILVP